MRLGVARLLGRAARSEVSDDGCADLGSALTAILEKEPDEVLHPAQIGSVDDRPAAALRRDQPRVFQHPKVRRERVVRHAEATRHVTSGQSLGLVRDQEAESIQPC